MIELRDLRKDYRVGDVDLSVLKGITLDIETGGYVALMGTSGSGKTTLMNLLGSLDSPTSGSYRLAGVDLDDLSSTELAAFRSKQIGFVFQNFNLLARTTALDNVLLPTLYCNDGRTQQERVEYARRLLDSVGLSGRADHFPNQLSGGERQRVAIARALVNRPRLLLADEPTGNLDSKTEQEILAVFRKLNEEHGITLVVVTHDAEVAEQADRVIRMKDGVVVEDHESSLACGLRAAIQTHPTSRDREDSQPDNFVTPARPRTSSIAATLNAVTVATAALRRNLLRTSLTMLGVIIGVASVISVMELSTGASAAIKDTVASMGASMLTVSPSKAASNGAHQRPIHLIPSDVTAVTEQCSAVKVAAPLIYSHVQVVRGNRRWRPTLCLGTTPEYLSARNWDELALGKSFTQDHVFDSAKVCVLGQTVINALFDDAYPIGEEVRVNGVPMQIVGVLSEKGGDVIGNDQDDIMIGPWTTLKFRVNDQTNTSGRLATFANLKPQMQLTAHRQNVHREEVHQIYVQAKSPAAVDQARDQITRVLSRRHNVEPVGAYRMNDITEVSKVVNQVVAGLSLLGLIIAGVSLMVGGVGIMNIMLVSVTERTREIGLRMAVGADRKAILRQFLIEATVLCLIGGLIGIAAGHFWSVLIAKIIGWPTVWSLWAPIVAVTVAAGVGILFGYYPARKASQLNPIDALRYE
ncbi:macrolide transport system ATP-binding/permease protein [Neorhodopirellula lusitana]|uniref:Macrolide transport system ATP-binding/permease protein n=1 Tax=Neorhodopirellula lusitana TaxID=445327 RepID=A0ABY1QC34_9BACT|nr:ABC transporter permease [Neorhodopirellula lusitana]SMP66143.1 macrolide transport system ATP-binding/permease protein [Neorhodopirellula lusitana]